MNGTNKREKRNSIISMAAFIEEDSAAGIFCFSFSDF